MFLLYARSMTATLVVAIAMSEISMSAWRPPANPNPREILEEARENIRNGEYSVALEQLTWFHKHALQHSPLLYAVRLTSAMNSWQELAGQYPPAVTALRDFRREATESLLAEGNAVRGSEIDVFADLVAIDYALGNSRQTIEVFRQLHHTKPVVARQVYPRAQELLVKSGEWELCGQYLDPLNYYGGAIRGYEAHREIVLRGPQSEQKQQLSYGESSLLRRACTVIAILARNDRMEEAAVIAENLVTRSKDPRRFKFVASALEGDAGVLEEIRSSVVEGTEQDEP